MAPDMSWSPKIDEAKAAKLNAKWAALRRSTPDPSVRNASSPWAFRLLNGITWIPYIPLCGVYGGYLTIRHLLTRPPWAGWTWDRMIRNRLNKLWNEMTAWYLDPLELDSDGYRVPETTRATYDMAEKRGEVRVVSVSIPPVDGVRVGIAIAGGEAVDVVARPGWWVSPGDRDPSGRAEPGERVFLHIHGGGYRRGSPLWNLLPLRLVRTTGLRLLSTNYRKPLSVSTAFPAPLLDAVGAYVHLLRLGFAADNITIVGKSAGGHLAMMLSRYISDLGLEQPSYILVAPWLDLSLSSPSYALAGYDTLVQSKLVPAVKSSLRWYTPDAMGDAYFNPVLAQPDEWEYLRGTKVYMTLGTREKFQDEIRLTGLKMREAGVDVQIREDINGLHTSLLNDPVAMGVFLEDVCEFLSVKHQTL